jgi:hypothetical protein
MAKERQALKRELQILRENRKPQDIITVVRKQLVLSGNSYAIVEKEVQTTHQELEVENKILRMKIIMNGATGLSY